MSSPITISTTVLTIFTQNLNRAKVFMQNTGNELIYCTKQFNGTVRTPSATDYDFILYPGNTPGNSENVKESPSIFEAYTVGGIKAVSTSKGSALAYFETDRVKI